MISKKFIIGVSSLFFSLSIFCASPRWLTELEKEFPSTEYLRMIGEGTTLKLAESDAVASIAQNFNAKVKVINQSIKDYNSIITEDKSETSKSYSFNQVSKISSDAELLCLKYSEPYYDKKNKKYYVVAYINRKESGEFYAQKINGILLQIKDICELARNEKEVLYSVVNLQKAKRLSKIATYYIDTACIINPTEIEKYKDDTELIAKLTSLLSVQEGKGTFSVSCNNSKYNSVCTGISSILEESGFVVSKKNPVYRIYVEINFSEEVYEAGNFVRPDICITVANASGKEIDSYSKIYPRYSHQTMENAYNLALVRIQQDLEENFLLDYRNVE